MWTSSYGAASRTSSSSAVSRMRRMTEPEVGPGNCRLCVAIPLSQREFEDDVAAGRDYAGTLARTYGNARYAWTRVYERIAEMAMGVLEDVNDQGVTVAPRAGRAALVGASEPIRALV